MPLTEVLLRIQQRETGVPVSPEVIAEMHELAETYSVDSNPEWLLPIFEAVEQGLGLIRFGGRIPRGGYDVQDGRERASGHT